MKQTKQLSILLMLALLAGCAGANHGAVKVAIKPETTFAKNASITVVPAGGDDRGAQAKLERLLTERGFQIVPQPAAEIAVDKLKSDYLFQFQYETDSDTDPNILEEFGGTVIDVREGHVVASLNFKGKRPLVTVLEQCADKLAEAMK
jgi:hypothetical protein